MAGVRMGSGISREEGLLGATFDEWIGGVLVVDDAVEPSEAYSPPLLPLLQDPRRRSSISGMHPLSPSNMVKLPQVPDTMRNTDLPSDRERIETEIIKSLIESYFNIVRKNFLDMVPKTIMYFLVNHAKDSIQNELVSELYKEGEIADLLRETDDVAQRRKTCKEMRGLLSRALEIVNEVRDFDAYRAPKK